MGRIELVAFDADDTLWHCESQFAHVHNRYAELLGRYVDGDQLSQRVSETEIRNLRLFGYGVKGFTLSLIETAIEVSDHRVSATEIAEILQLGQRLIDHPIELMDGAAETVAAVAATVPTIIITKGDLVHQESKVARSGLGEVVAGVEVVADKTPQAYRRILGRLGVDPGSAVMVGDSLRSDILPVLEIGGRAVHVPPDLAWDHERMPGVTPSTHGYDEVDNLRQVPTLLDLSM